MLAVGFFLKNKGLFSESITFGRYGKIDHQTMDGPASIYMGILILVLSVYFYWEHRRAKKERLELFKKSVNNSIKRKSKNVVK